jgi:UDP:flavonoid glycosyltransferase YjiC (YdhE family)
MTMEMKSRCREIADRSREADGIEVAADMVEELAARAQTT